MRRIIIAGGSTAGLAAARALRADEFEGEIVLVDPEPHPPYDRTALSKATLREANAAADPLMRTDDLDALQLSWRRGRRATALNARSQELSLDDGGRLSYDGLILATGSRPRTLSRVGDPPAGVLGLRTLDDAVRLRAALARARQVVLIGAGFIGLEVAAAARELALEVTIVEAAPTPLAVSLGTRVGAAIGRRHTAAGARLLTGTSVRRLVGKPALRAIELDDGRTLTADLAVIGVGAVPNTDWLSESGIADHDGVACNADLATALPGVVAAGDIARWPHAHHPGPIRIEHFEHAELSGAHAARRLLHGPQVGPYTPVPFVWSHQGPHTIHVAGFPSPGAELELVDGELDDGPFAVAYRRDGALVGVASVDHPRAFRRLRRELTSQGVAA